LHIVKKLMTIACLALFTLQGFAQQKSKNARREEKKQKINAMIRQEEEGVLIYQKQTAFGAQLRTNGYGIFFELGRMKTPRWTQTYSIELTETKHPKEEKSTNVNSAFNNSFVYGKINNFYQLKLGYGRQYILGQKGNKNGVAVIALAEGGLALGMLRPYYIDIQEGNNRRSIKYDSKDSLTFLGGGSGAEILGSSGLLKGWNELQLRPGAYIKAALRFDFNKYNERMQAIQIGLSLEAFPQEIRQMVDNKPQRLFFQGHLAYVFGGRK